MSNVVIGVARDHWDHGRKMYIDVLRKCATDAETLAKINEQSSAIEAAAKELLRIEGMINRNV